MENLIVFRTRDGLCMVAERNSWRWEVRPPYNLRDADEIEAPEWAKLERARRTSDLRKLRALLPAWLRSHIKAGELPKPRERVTRWPVVVPQLGTRQTDPHTGYKFPREDSTARYVREFCRANNLRMPARAGRRKVAQCAPS